MKTLELLVHPLQRRGEDLFALGGPLGGSRKACSPSSAFSARFSPFLSTQRLLLVAHLAQTGSYGLKLSWLDLIYCGMVREVDCLVFVVAEDAAFELTRDRHSVPPFGSRSSRKKED